MSDLVRCSVELIALSTSFKMDQVLFNPFTKCKVLDVNMACAASWLLRISHCSTAIIIFICYCGCFLWDVYVPKDTANKEAHSTYITGGHEFCFSGGEGNCGLKFRYRLSPPDRKIQTPVNERRVLVHVAQSESVYTTAVKGL